MQIAADRTMLHVERMDVREANGVVAREHYLHRSVYIAKTIAYRVTYDGLGGFGVLVFGYPVFREKRGLLGIDRPRAWRCCARNPRRVPCRRCHTSFKTGGHFGPRGYVCGGCRHGWVRHHEPYTSGELVELQRVWLPETFPKNSESCAIRRGMRLLWKDWPPLVGRKARAVISYADPKYHFGRVYEAVGFAFIGMTTSGRSARPGRVHGRDSHKSPISRPPISTPISQKRAYLVILERIGRRAGPNLQIAPAL